MSIWPVDSSIAPIVHECNKQCFNKVLVAAERETTIRTVQLVCAATDKNRLGRSFYTIHVMCSMESIASIQEAGPLILDGGLATELEAQGFGLQVSHRYPKPPGEP